MNTLIKHQIETIGLSRDVAAAATAFADSLCVGSPLDLANLKESQSKLLRKLRDDYGPTRDRVHMKIMDSYINLRDPRSFIRFAFVDDAGLAQQAIDAGIHIRPVVTAEEIAAACNAWQQLLRFPTTFFNSKGERLPGFDAFIAEVIAHMRADGGKFWSLV